MGAYSFELDKVLTYGMLPVVRKRDILKIRLLTRQEKKNRKHGSADIVATTPLGTQFMISRDKILTEYRYLSGNKISFAGLSCNTEYIVFKPDNTNAFAVKIPLNCSVEGVEANKSKRSSGDYIVVFLDQYGEMDYDTAGVVPAAVFKKMFYMPPHEEINKFKDRPPTREYIPGISKDNTLEDSIKQVNDMNTGYNKPRDYVNELNLNPSSFNFGDENLESSQDSQPVQLNLGGNANNTQRNVSQMPRQAPNNAAMQSQTYNKSNNQQTQTGKYTAIARLINNNGVLVGFVIANRSGKTKNLTLQQMYQACSNHLVDNVAAGVRSDTQKKFFRGTTSPLTELPEQRI